MAQTMLVVFAGSVLVVCSGACVEDTIAEEQTTLASWPGDPLQVSISDDGVVDIELLGDSARDPCPTLAPDATWRVGDVSGALASPGSVGYFSSSGDLVLPSPFLKPSCTGPSAIGSLRGDEGGAAEIVVGLFDGTGSLSMTFTRPDPDATLSRIGEGPVALGGQVRLRHSTTSTALVNVSATFGQGEVAVTAEASFEDDTTVVVTMPPEAVPGAAQLEITVSPTIDVLNCEATDCFLSQLPNAALTLADLVIAP